MAANSLATLVSHLQKGLSVKQGTQRREAPHLAAWPTSLTARPVCRADHRPPLAASARCIWVFGGLPRLAEALSRPRSPCRVGSETARQAAESESESGKASHSRPPRPCSEYLRGARRCRHEAPGTRHLPQGVCCYANMEICTMMC